MADSDDQYARTVIGDLRAANWFETFLSMKDHKQERTGDNSE